MPRPVVNHVSDRAEKLLDKLVPRVKAAIDNKRCQASYDMWTYDNVKSHFIVITVTFMNETAETYDLVTAKFSSAEKTTSGTRCFGPWRAWASLHLSLRASSG